MSLTRKTLLVAAGTIAGLVGLLAVTLALAHARVSRSTLLLLLSVASGAGVLVTVLLMERFVLSRLRTIQRGVDQVAASGDPRTRLHGLGRDEVGALAVRINDMLGTLQRSHEAVEESEARYRSVIEQASEGIVLADMDTLEILEGNEAACRLLRYSPEELRVRTLMDLGIAAPSEVREIARRVRFERRLERIPLTAARHDGARVELEVSCSAASLHGRQVVWLLLRDVSLQRRAQESLLRRESILKAVSYAAERFLREGPEAIPNVLERLGQATNASRVYLWKNHEGPDGGLLASQRYEWAGPGIQSQQGNPDLQGIAYRDGGFERWEGILRAGGEIAGPVADLPEAEQAILAPQAIRSVAVVPVFVGQAWWGFMGFDDCVAPRSWSEAEIEGLRAAAGIIGGLIQRQRSVERIAEAEAKYRALVEQIPAAIFIDALDEEASTIYISPQIEQILGFPPEQWRSDPDLWFKQIHPDDLERVRAANRRHVHELEPFAEEYRIRDRRGALLWVRDEAVVVSDERGRPRFSQGFLMDVTERRRVEESVRRQNEYLSALHDTALDLMDRLELSDLLGDMVGRAADLIGTGHGFLYLPAEDGEGMEMKVGVGVLSDLVGLRVQRGEGASGRAWDTGEAVVVPDYRAWDGRLQVELATEAVVSVPLKSGPEVVGVLGLAHVDPELSFSDEDVRLASGFAEFAAIALDNARLYDAAQREIAERERAQADLEEQEERFRALANSALEGICIHENGTILEVNRAFAEMVGVPPEELVGTDVLDLAPTAERGAVRRRIEDGSTVSDEHGLRRRDGSVMTVEVTGRSLPFRGRRARVVTFRDVTEQRRREEQDRLLHAITRSMAEAEDLDAALRVVLREVCRVTGWRAGEAWVPGPDRDRIVPSEAWYSDEAGLESFRESSLLAELTSEDALPGRAWRSREPLWVPDLSERREFPRAAVAAEVGLRAGAAIPVLAGGDVTAVLCFWMAEAGEREERFVDLVSSVAEQLGLVVLRKSAEQAIRAAEEKYRGIFENAAEGIFRTTPAGVFESVNPALARMMGYGSSEELLDEVESIDVLPIDPEDRAERRRQIEETGGVLELEYRARRRDGRVIWVSENARPVRDDAGRLLSMEGTLLNITQRRVAEEGLRDAYEREREAAERLREVDEMKNAFLSAVSHELRTPLSSILGFALTLERAEVTLPPEQVQEMVGRIAVNAQKLQRLLTDLLDLDRISRGILEPARRRTDVGELATRVAQEADLGDRPLLIEADPLFAFVDAAKVERIVENLLANAAKYTPERTPVWVRTAPRDEGVLLIVEDGGPGVPEDLRETVFRPFEQGDDTPAHAPGTGIGLSLVARFAELHGGRAWVEEREGGGASFRVYLPGLEVEAGEEELPRVSDRSGR